MATPTYVSVSQSNIFPNTGKIKSGAVTSTIATDAE